MRIALVTDGVYPFVVGGMQRHSAYLTRYLTRQGAQVILVHCTTHGELPSKEEVIDALGIDHPENLEIITLRFPSFGKLPGHYLRESLVYSEMALKALNEHLASLDLIYAKGLSGWMMAEKRRKRLLNVPLAVKFHGYEMYQTIPGWRNRFARMLLRGPVKFINQNADWVFSYGGKITEIITNQLGVRPDKVLEIPTGIAEEWIADSVSLASGLRRLVFVGRYERRKGVEELSAAIQDLLRSHEFAFDFIGPVPFNERIKHPNVHYHGQLTDTNEIKAILDTAQVLVTPSHAEGMPNVILEGMSRGLAVIATDVGAISAMVDSSNGWLIEANNATDLKTAIRESLTIQPERLEAMQQRSIQRAMEQFTWSAVAHQTLNVLRQISHQDAAQH